MLLLLTCIGIFLGWSPAPAGHFVSDKTDTAKIAKKESNPGVHVSSGHFERFHFHSHFVDDRNVDVWLPKGYSKKQKYAVVYMQDGQMLFDSTTTWNRQEWKVDEVMTKLIDEHKIQPAIVVGIWNNGKKRAAEYFPQKAMRYIPETQRDSLLTMMPGGVISDHYLQFMVDELKPFVDSHFSTYTDRQHTFVIGSSFGGLIALYAINEYPKVFGGAACLSTHWTGLLKANKAIPAALDTYVASSLPSPKNHKLYFDHGTETLDALYAPYQSRIDSVVDTHGYGSQNFESLVFPGADHSEKSWSKRLHVPLIFLLGKE